MSLPINVVIKKNIIITGSPRSGKSTLLWNVISTTHQKVGFVTHELREAGERFGFETETHTGEKIVLASTKLQTDFKVSKYFVAPKNLDAIVPHVASFTNNDLLFLDEIGQMELFSESFKSLVSQYLGSGNTCIATLSKVYSDDFTERIRARGDVILVELSEQNRDQQQAFVQALLSKIDKARKYIKEPERFTPHQKAPDSGLGMKVPSQQAFGAGFRSAPYREEAASSYWRSFTVAEDIVKLTSAYAERTLKKVHGEWECDCVFFSKHQICSHTIALDEYLKSTQT